MIPTLRRGMALRFLAALSAACMPSLRAGAAERIGYHEVRTDGRGLLVPWYGTGPSQAYDHVIRRVWDFWITMRPCPNGVPYYLLHQVWKADQDDPRGLGGDQLCMALSSWNLLYAYTGDPAVRDNMRLMADYWIGHGLAAEDLPWGGLPYPYNLDNASGRYDGDMRAGPGFLQPDKAASFGAELVMLYKATGERRYLERAVRIADRLAHNAVPGDGENSPWPFRVNAATGAVHEERNDRDHRVRRASYTTNWTGALRLFDELAALGEGHPEAYRACSSRVTQWLKRYPMRTQRWGPFFEDVSTKDDSDTEINADTLAAYLLEHPGWDPEWRARARAILDGSYATFANHDDERWGAVSINEQTAYMEPGNSHTARHAAVELLYAEKTGDWGARDAAVRRLTWSTYWVAEDGRNQFPHDDIWLTDGYGDFVRHYLRAMASDPRLAPDDQDHLLRTSSVIRSIRYAKGSITFDVFDGQSEELFKLGASSPSGVKGGTLDWDRASRVLWVHAHGRCVAVALGPRSP